MQEIWADIEGYEGLYQASNLGNIKSLLTSKLLKASVNSSGYLKVELHNKGKAKVFYVHRLIASTFIPNPSNKPQVNHRNGNKLCNSVDNLEWVTASENQKHAVEIGIHAEPPFKGKLGKSNPMSKPIIQYDADGNFMRTWDSPMDAALHYNILADTIRACTNGGSHSAFGYIWKRYTPNFPVKIESLESIYRKNQPIRKGVHKKKIKVNQYTKNGLFIKQWSSLEDISQNSSFNTNNILRNINGKRKSAYGYIWKVADD